MNPTTRLRAVFGLVLLLSCARPPSPSSAAPIVSPTAIAASPPSVERTFHWHGRVADGLEVDVRAIRGDVAADGAADGEVDVSAVKSGSERSWRDLAVRMETTDRGVVFCVVDARSTPAEGCRGGREVHSSRDARVDFRVSVPRGVRFVGKSVDGDVSAQGLALPVALSAVNGRVRAVDVEATRLVTVNGSIVASLRVEQQGEDVELSTVNGDIEVRLPALLGEDVTVAGPRVTTSGAREVRLLLGQGPGVLRARTVNGSVRLARSS